MLHRLKSNSEVIRVSPVETGLYYINGNYYDPESGRYVGCGDMDNVLSETGDRNLYSFADNNPVMFTPNMMTMLSSQEMSPETELVRKEFKVAVYVLED